MKIQMPAASSVVQVGFGRGFVFEQKTRTPGRDRLEFAKFKLVPFLRERCIITAAHCLPHFPVPHACERQDRIYPDLLGVLDEKPSVWALLLFADPIADIAVLGCVDGQNLPEQAEAFEQFIEPLKAIPLAQAQTGKGWMLSLDKPYEWRATTIDTGWGSLISGATTRVSPVPPS
jgi:hypothetical protein